MRYERMASATTFDQRSNTIYAIEQAKNTKFDNKGPNIRSEVLYPESEIRRYYWN